MKLRNWHRAWGLTRKPWLVFDPTITVEGAATAKAVRKLARDLDIDLPICTVVAELCNRETSVQDALNTLLSRPLKEE